MLLERLQPSAIFKSHFNTKAATIICFLLALTNKCLLAWIYTDLEGDKALYLLFAKSMMNGQHPLEEMGLINGIQNIFFNGGIHSPLYSVIAIPFLWLTGSFTATSFIIDILSWIIFFSGLYKCAYVILGEKWIANIFILCTGFFLYPHELESTPKDTMAIGLLFWSCFLFMRFVSDPPKFRNSFLMVLALLGFCLLKFLYAPLMLLFLILLFFFAVKKRKKFYLKHAFFISASCLLFCFAYYGYIVYLKQLSQAKMMQDIQLQQVFIKGFYPQNMRQAFPFISAAILNTNFWCVQIADILNQSFADVMRFFKYLDLLLVIFILVYIRKKISGKINNKPFWIAAPLISAAILFMLFFMSLRYKAVLFDGYSSYWTYVKEPRSYLFIIVFLQVSLLYFIFKKKGKVAFKNFLLFLFFIECFHGAYFTVKQVSMSGAIRHAFSNTKPVKKITNILSFAHRDQTTIALSTPDAPLRRYALLNNIPVLSYRNQPCNMAEQSETKRVLIAVYEKDTARLDTCIDKYIVRRDTISPFILLLYEQK